MVNCDELIQTQNWDERVWWMARDDSLGLASKRSPPSVMTSHGEETTAGNPSPDLRALFEGPGLYDTWLSVRAPSGPVHLGWGHLPRCQFLAGFGGLMPQ